MSAATMLRADTWERVQMSIDDVKDRLDRITAIFNAAQVPYAVVGGNAVSAHIVQARDKSYALPTKDVDIMVRRSDLPRVIEVARKAGFYHAKSMGIDMLRDGPDAGVRESVHLIFEKEKVRPHEPVSNPGIDDSVLHPDGYRILSLQGIVQIKLTAFRPHDQGHLIKLFQQKLIDAAWAHRYPSPLAERLTEISELPEVKDYTEKFDEEGN